MHNVGMRSASPAVPARPEAKIRLAHPGLLIVAVASAAALTACSKPATPPETATTSAEQPSAAPAQGMSEEEMKKALASLPAPYNAADLENGKAKFALCQTCHTITKDAPNMIGPNLSGVFGRKAGTLPGFSYSDGLKAASWTWDAPHVDTWITDPKAVAPGTKMTFAGLKDPKDRTDVIAYLMVNSGYKP